MTYVVGEWDDWYRHEEASAVFVQGKVIVLSELATELVSGIQRGERLSSLVEAMVSRFGLPPAGDPALAIKGALDELVLAGVLREVG
jgi:hypothetical protein